MQAWFREWEYSSAPEARDHLVRTWFLLKVIPEELSDDVAMDPLPTDLLESATGVDLQSFICLSLGLLAYMNQVDFEYANSIETHLADIDPVIFQDTVVDADQQERFLQHLSLSEQDISEIKRSDPSDPRFYRDFSRLANSPLLATDDGYVPISFRMLRWRITQGIYWEIQQTAKEAPGGLDIDEKVFMTAFGTYFQEFITRVLIKVLPNSSSLVQRLWTELQLDNNDPEFDLILYYPGNPGAYVIVEMKAARLHYMKSVVEDSLDYIKNTDLKKLLYGPVEQLDEQISYFQKNAHRLIGQTYKGETIYPVLITYGGFPTMAPVWEYLLGKVDQRGYLQQPNNRPLIALDADEAIMLAGLASSGHSIKEVIDTKLCTPDLSFRSFVFKEYDDVPIVSPLDRMTDKLRGECGEMLFDRVSN